jgi:hypothetical protein
MAWLPRWQCAKYVAVEFEKDPRAMDDLGLVVGRHFFEQVGEVPCVFLVQRAVRAQVGEGLVGQSQRLLDPVGGGQGQRDAGAFEDEHHAEESGRIAPVDQVVGIGHHDFGRQVGLAAPHRVGVAAGRGNVVEDPFFVADFLVDVVRHRAAQPGQAFRQAPAEAHQQGRGVAHVVVGLAEERQVAVARDAALQAVGDDRCRQQLGP